MIMASALTLLLALGVPRTTSFAPSWGSHHRLLQAVPTSQASSTTVFATMTEDQNSRARDVFSLVTESHSDSGTINEVELLRPSFVT
jgi:hypothetical protein